MVFALSFAVLVKDFIMILSLFIASCVAGVTVYSCELACESEGVLCVLAFIFYPITMILGIIKGCGEIFC